MAVFCDEAFTKETGVGELNLTSNWLWFWIFIWLDFGRLGDRWFRFFLKLKTFHGSIKENFWYLRHFLSVNNIFVTNISFTERSWSSFNWVRYFWLQSQDTGKMYIGKSEIIGDFSSFKEFLGSIPRNDKPRTRTKWRIMIRRIFIHWNHPTSFSLHNWIILKCMLMTKYFLAKNIFCVAV